MSMNKLDRLSADHASGPASFDQQWALAEQITTVVGAQARAFATLSALPQKLAKVPNRAPVREAV
jgi:hypothetical protein